MAKPLSLDLSDVQELCNLGKALSSPVRLEVLKLLYTESLSIVEISDKLSIAPSSAALHVKMLETAGLINAEVQPGTRGAVKLCSRRRDSVNIDLTDVAQYVHEVITVDMPVGAYSFCDARPTCGLADENGMIGNEDVATCFYLPERFRAQLLWSAGGYVEYCFPNKLPKNKVLRSISFTMEIWQDGCYINEERAGNVTVEQLGILPDKVIVLRIGNKEDAKYIGGFNIFGEKYGDYPQNIVMSLEY